MDELETAVRRAQDGDLPAYDALVRRFQDVAVATAYARLGDFAAAQDAAQEAFLLAYRQLGSLREPAAFAGWLRRIVFTQCDRITRRKRPIPVDPETMRALTGAHSSSGELDSAELAERKQLRQQVRSAIAELPEGQREVTTLFYMSDHSVAEVAGLLDISVTAVKSRLHAARERLRERMMDMVKDTLRSEAPSRNEEFVSRVRDLLREIKFMLNAQDMERAVGFYRDVIGLELKVQSPHWSELRMGDAVIALHGGGDGAFNETGLSFTVEDLDEACSAIVAGGGKLRSGPSDRPGEPIRLAELTDSEGNGFMMSEDKI